MEAESKVEGKEAKREIKEAIAETKVEAKADAAPETKPEAKAETKAETKTEKTGAKAEAAPARKRKSIAARAWDAGVSLKSSKKVCDAIRGRKLDKAVKLLENMVAEKRSIRGRYYTKTSEKFIELLKNAESNARVVGMDAAKLHVYVARASKGRTFYRPRSRLGRTGEKAKLSNIEIIVGEK
ncbi:MAG: uL22 family ribosomal protein [Candidatus Aenigmatarchaeota archaeon]